MRQASDVVVRDSLALLVWQCGNGAPEVLVTGTRNAQLRLPIRKFSHRDGVALARANHVDRLAVGDGNQPGLNIRPVIERWVRRQRSQKCFGPGVLRIVLAEHRPAYPQHGETVVGDDLLERLLHSAVHVITLRSLTPLCFSYH